MCDAGSEAAVSRLRTRKRRPDKPLAVMVPEQGEDGGDAVRRCAVPGAGELAALRDPRRAIVLCRAREDSGLAPSVAPGLREVGVFLPYSPLHYLLLEDFGAPLVATSGNVSGEPVLTDPAETERRLGGVADAFLHHDRPIRRPADDAVCRIVAGGPRPLRLGRGMAPLELELAEPLRVPTLAVGGHMKNTVALGWGRRVVVSPHIGDLDSPRALAVFGQVSADLQRLYGVAAQRIVCDAHPGYASARWAADQGLPVERVFHHRAHAAALAAEHGLDGELLAFTWDGTGYGEDGTIWGGEALLGAPGRWQRVASFRSLRLPGGDRAGREPWRAAAAMAWALGEEAPGLPEGAELAHEAWRRGVNCPESSAVGRLFDGAASLLGLCSSASYEGQGPMELEAAAHALGTAEPLALDRDGAGIWRADWADLWRLLGKGTASTGVRAAGFHAVLAATLVRMAVLAAEEHGVRHVGLSGGVFQNRLLAEAAVRGLEQAGLTAHLAVQVPCNDAGISFGQLAELAGRDGLAGFTIA
jgi:hydrogenase maturation protein HypF